ncbi:MAG: OmpA family protein [candidate division KSB1 bacterium]|nr:OmpA family protein [candidate division KSB1 bacterium]MDZ7275003.1 OmpA family protein [candidate division KSB1 bacterium]MDZ7286548.1 OmpA family protein [candidate division KSB1 bacterium]MDZ7299288.1 OmpA family protein [candidate division KSB1 bacterium]MDZ7307373.1 OmpA family protein [candidate division KSB1 bacterium]
MRNHLHKHWPLLAGLLLLAQTATAQLADPRNPSTLQDSRIVFANPAATALLAGQAYLGLQLIYPGAIADNAFALKASHLAVTWPGLGGTAFGAGLHLRHFSAPLFSENRLGLLAACALHEKLALGGDLAVRWQAYDRGKFDLVDADDPVFRRTGGPLIFDPGLGLLARVHETVLLGASVYHFNRPNLARAGERYLLPAQAALGATFDHRFGRFDLGIAYHRQQWQPAFGAEVFAKRLGRLRLGYGAENAVFEGELLLPPAAALLYSFHLPTSDLGLLSSGSHELGVKLAVPWLNPPAAEPEAPFYLQAFPPSRVVLPDDTPLYNLNLVRRENFTKPVQLEVRELPPPLRPRLSQSTVRGIETVILALEAPGKLQPGDYPFIITARAPGHVHHLPVHLRVNNMPRLVPEIFATIDSVEIIELRNVLEELPLIPRLFFPQSQSRLPENRYDLLSPQQHVFVMANVTEINAAYRNLLNIMAARLAQNRTAVITLTGYSSGPPYEADWRSLALGRARAVKNYLVDSLQVLPEQVVIAPPQRPARSHALPSLPRQEEWQRVEISAPPPFEQQILGPLLVTKKEVEAQPPRCAFVTKYSVAEAGLAAWQITLMNDQQDTVEVLAGNAEMPDTVFWEWQHALVQQHPKAATAVEAIPLPRGSDNAGWPQSGFFTLTLRDALGQTATSPQRRLAIRHRTRLANEVGIERIPIFLFGFAEHQFSSHSRQLRKKLRLIAAKLEADPEATCLLKGHTDAIGDQLNNRWLSIRRAKTVFDMLASFGISPERMTYIGLGEEEPLADNRLPEGRMMNRRVEVHIRHSPNWRNTAARFGFD